MTYYLKAVFHTPQLSQLLHVHVAILTLWIVLYVAQNLLILDGKVSTHRRLGWALGALAVLLLNSRGADCGRVIEAWPFCSR